MTFSNDELARLRRDTPACENLVHFNNAGASLMPAPVLDAVTGHLALEAEIGGYEAAERAADEIEAMYTGLAQLLGAKPAEIAYVENATRAWDMAFYALPLGPGDRILTHSSEYVSNYLAFLHQARRRGVEIDIAPSDASGQIDVESLPGLITSRTRLIALTHVPTSGGLVNPAAKVGRVAREHGLIYLLDACQSTGQLALDVSEIGCDILSGTGRKFLRGPRGSGFLYVADAILDRLEPPFVDLHSVTWTAESRYDLAPGAKRFENWESFVAGRVGLAKAVGYALDIGVERIERRVRRLGQTLRAALTEIGADVHDMGESRCGIVTFAMAGLSAGEIKAALRAEGCNVSVVEPLEARLDVGRRKLPALVRASLHYYNTEDEIAWVCSTLSQLRRKL